VTVLPDIHPLSALPPYLTAAIPFLVGSSEGTEVKTETEIMCLRPGIETGLAVTSDDPTKKGMVT
jgi:hypothetical protein